MDKKSDTLSREVLDLDWNDVLKVAGALGGLASISAGVAAYVGSLISSRIVETHKANLGLQLETHKSELSRIADSQRLLLKRQELMFEREYAAASDFYKLFSEIIPDPWAPGLEWADAQTRIAENFHKHEAALGRFLIAHSASLSQPVRQKLEKAKQAANEGIFEVGYETHSKDYERKLTPAGDVINLVDQFYELLKEADKQIRLDLERGSFSATKET